jgi:hypothetical protein
MMDVPVSAVDPGPLFSVFSPVRGRDGPRSDQKEALPVFVEVEGAG